MARDWNANWPHRVSSNDCYIVSNARFFDTGGGPKHKSPYLCKAASVIHYTQKAAVDEAERLARENVGESYIVWRPFSISGVINPPVKTEKFK